ncbi:MAG TPA: radical SAM protein [Rhizomicrobium sp.]|nr:radical SAM protein [Rhizomicrobium sp.]
MANILLTNKCIRECPYCFAGREMAQSEGQDFLSWENAVYLADFLTASGERRVSLLGGEPSLHPEFVDITLYFVARGFDVNVFTSAIMSSARLETLARHVAAAPAERLNFVCNLNDPEQTPTTASEREQVEAFLARLGAWTMPAFNIYRPDFRLEFLFGLVERFGLRKRLRLGITHPIAGAGNAWIRAGEIGAVIERLCSYRHAFEAALIRPSFDCGFPLCRVVDADLGWLTRLGASTNFKCRPAIDITPDMEVYCCFPLSFLDRRSVFEFDSFRQIVEHYRKLQERVRTEIAGIYDECGSCIHRSEATCAGGGVCHIVNRLAAEAPATLKKIADDQACLS